MSGKQRTLIIGASGLIGRYLFDFLKQQKREVVGTYNRNKNANLIHFDLLESPIKDLPIKNIKYGVICSAIAKIDECKKNPVYSRKVNVSGVEKIISYLSEKGIVPVFISGAVVFNGVGGEKEEDKRNPANLYGEQKKEVEDFIIENFKDYLIIRPGKVIGKKIKEGGLFADWLLKYKNKDKILCAYDEEMSVTYAGDLAKAISLLMKRDLRGIFHINPQWHYSRFQYALDFFSYLKIKDVKLERCSLDNFNFLDKRAKNAFLDSSKFIRETGFEFTKSGVLYEMIKQNF